MGSGIDSARLDLHTPSPRFPAIQSTALFETADLLEGVNLKLVVRCILALKVVDERDNDVMVMPSAAVAAEATTEAEEGLTAESESEAALQLVAKQEAEIKKLKAKLALLQPEGADDEEDEDEDENDGHHVHMHLTLEDLSPEVFTEDKQEAYVAQLAANLGLDPSQIEIASFTAGSLIVETHFKKLSHAEAAQGKSLSLG